ncbi:MAG: hypothetical protein QM755_06745 [Luteolibacter sp.]
MPFSLSNLHFSPTPVTLAVGLAALLAVIVLAILSWKRSPHPRRTALLEGLRVLATLIVGTTAVETGVADHHPSDDQTADRDPVG